MYRPDKLIRLGLWLVPWLPVFLLVVWVHAAYFAAPVYVSTEKLVVHLDGSSSNVPVAPAEPRTASFHVSPALVVLLCVLCAFLAGCASLLVGFSRRSRSITNSPPSTYSPLQKNGAHSLRNGRLHACRSIILKIAVTTRSSEQRLAFASFLFSTLVPPASVAELGSVRRLRAFPGRTSAVPDATSAFSARISVVPVAIPAVPDAIPAFSGHVSAILGAILAVSGRILAAPGAILALPDRVLAIPDASFAFSGRVSAVPDAISAFSIPLPQSAA